MEKRDKGAGGTDAGSPKGGQSGLVPGERSQRRGPRGSWEARGRATFRGHRRPRSCLPANPGRAGPRQPLT